MIRKLTIPLALLAVFVLSGCGGKAPASRMKVYWPPPPAESQMEWIMTYTSAQDFPKTSAEITAAKFFGKQKFDRFLKPSGVASLGDGVVYVADLDARNIRVIDFNNNKSTVYGSGSSVGVPVGLALDSKGTLFVADTFGKQILVFNNRSELVRGFGAGELVKPTFIALDEVRGRIYVSDVVKSEVVVFDLDSGAKLFAFGGKGKAKGQLYGPQGIAIDKDGRIFVAEQFNARVQVFDTEGKHLYMFGSRGDKAFQFEGPRGLAFDSEENLFVIDARKPGLLVFQPDGTPLTSIGGQRTGHPLGFVLPSAIYIDPNDRIYITDGINRRITIWQMLTPAYLAEHPLDAGSIDSIKKRVYHLQSEERSQ